ncbi:MAG: hypothetical protein HWN67_20735 [Candidatus Helarchaeota archaeon]|nr:hypothetical protein [Candidatus Helarchaeota archaeon]
MISPKRMIPVWFFVGILITLYGLVIFISGIYWYVHPINIVAGYLHAAIWWGILMTIFGLIFIIKNIPKKRKQQENPDI